MVKPTEKDKIFVSEEGMKEIIAAGVEIPPNVHIGTQEEAEACNWLVCSRLTSPLLMPDNLIDVCAVCGELVQHRPHAPVRPKKVCGDCVENDRVPQSN